MKKTISIVLSLLLCFSLAACVGEESKEDSEKSSSSVMSENSVVSEISDDKTSEQAPESADESNDVKSSDASKTAYEVKELGNVTFEARSGYDYTVKDTTAVVGMEADVAMITVSEQESSATKETEEILNEVFIKGMLDTFDEVQDKAEYDLELGGKSAKSVTCNIVMSGKSYNCSVSSVVNEGKQYAIVFIDGSSDMKYVDEFQHLVESFTFV